MVMYLDPTANNKNETFFWAFSSYQGKTLLSIKEMTCQIVNFHNFWEDLKATGWGK